MIDLRLFGLGKRCCDSLSVNDGFKQAGGMLRVPITVEDVRGVVGIDMS